MREEMRDQLVYREGEEEAEKEKEKDPQRCRIGFSNKRVVVVGYALTSKKTKSFLQPKLEGLARNKGILFVAIDHNRPLSDQGPFDIVLHKLSGREWRQILESGSLSFVTNHDSIFEVKASSFQQVMMFLLPWPSS